MLLKLAASFMIGIKLTMLCFVPFEYQRMSVDSAEVYFWFMRFPFDILKETTSQKNLFMNLAKKLLSNWSWL